MKTKQKPREPARCVTCGEVFGRDLSVLTCSCCPPRKHLKAELERLRTFVQRVYDECDRDIVVGETTPGWKVPGDMCVWTLRAEAKDLLEKGGTNE